MAKRLPIPSTILNETLDVLEERVPKIVEGKTDPNEMYAQLTKLLHDEFGRPRIVDLVEHSHRPWYLGLYQIDPENTEVGFSLPWRGPSPAGPVTYPIGAIWTSWTSGKVVYLSDVEKTERINPELHSSCTEKEKEENKMKGAEVVIPLFGPPFKRGRLKGLRSIVGAWDVDLNIKRIFGDEPAESNSYVQRLAQILREPGEQFFEMLYHGEAPFQPVEYIHVEPAPGRTWANGRDVKRTG